jgi:hypothetical protein
LQLDGRFRAALYTVFSVIFVTGAVWLVADRLKTAAGADLWSALAPVLLMAHGGAAMVALLLLGALLPLHLLPAWRRDKNRAMGVTMAMLTALLIATAFGLYYIGSDTLRGWVSDLHIALGLVFPALLTAHVTTGRRRCGRRNLELGSSAKPNPALGAIAVDDARRAGGVGERHIGVRSKQV